jgi:glyoxylase I family protein
MDITCLHHLGLTVTDVDASARWYQEVLGFQRIGEYTSPNGARRKIFLAHDQLRIRLGLCQHRNTPDRPFDEVTVGLDHLAFGVADSAELNTWVGRLQALGVPHSPVVPANSVPGAFVLVFRDPDNIQLELFADAQGDH